MFIWCEDTCASLHYSFWTRKKMYEHILKFWQKINCKEDINFGYEHLHCSLEWFKCECMCRISDATFNWCGLRVFAFDIFHSFGGEDAIFRLVLIRMIRLIPTNQLLWTFSLSLWVCFSLALSMYAIKSSTKYLWATNANLSNANM